VRELVNCSHGKKYIIEILTNKKNIEEPNLKVGSLEDL
jgi:hypothetical protein